MRSLNAARRLLLVAALTLTSICVSSISLAQAPDELSFQGYVTDPGGTPINHPGISIRFRLTEGSSLVWKETQPSVKIVDGIFNVQLGSVVPLDTVRFDRPLLLRIKVGTDPEISPITSLAAVPYARALPGLYTFYREDGIDSESYNVVGGAANNFVGSEAIGATIGGGGGFRYGGSVPNSVLSDFATVSGGMSNTASEILATVGGGNRNTASGDYATVGGGDNNTANGVNSTIGGGKSNTADTTHATVGGGETNIASGEWATVGGGRGNTASGKRATVGGGWSNTASGTNATVGGGWLNKASGDNATVPGGVANKARGDYSFAAGFEAKANHDGSFVWNDRSSPYTNDSLFTGAPNQFLARAAGGVTFYTKSDNSTGATLAANTGSWASVSDVNAKTGFNATEPTEVLERLSTVPIQTWRYKGQDESITHMGPTAQDFYAAFGLGIDDKHIVTVDADGVALAAIQGLYELVKDLQDENEQMRAAMERAGLE